MAASASGVNGDRDSEAVLMMALPGFMCGTAAFVR
jgi:hypothetical protein